MDEIIQAITNYGVGVFCIGYIIYMQNTTMKDMNNILTKMTETLNGIDTRLTIIEDKLERKEN